MRASMSQSPTHSPTKMSVDDLVESFDNIPQLMRSMKAHASSPKRFSSK